MSFSREISGGLEGVPINAVGTLVIIVCRGKHLPNRRKLDKQSPYVLVRMGTSVQRTPAKFRAGQTPEWLHEIRFDISHERRPVIRVDVLDETNKEPTAIGKCEIDCSTVYSNEGNRRDGKYILDSWYDLTLNGSRAGMIYFEMTFYPSVPLLPPKIASHEEHAMGMNNNLSIYSSKSHPLPPTPPPKHPAQLHPPNVADEIFSKSPDKKSKLAFISNAFNSQKESSYKNETNTSTVGSNKYKSKIGRFTKKFLSKEPITNLWDDDSMDVNHNRAVDLQNDHETEFDLEENFRDAPPPPPHHNVTQFNQNYYPKKMKGRKAPMFDKSIHPHEQAENLSTSIPFSADTLGLEEEMNAQPLPTKVYLMDQQSKSLTYSGRIKDMSEDVGKDEIHPRYFAPTPSEKIRKELKFKSNNINYNDVSTDFRTEETGYLGGGTWDKNTKFSPSVFDRVNDENIGFENKPQVPPKVPLGMTEKEYYAVDREKYLKDINGGRV